MLVLAGTKKGTFILESDAARKKWEVRGPFCEGRQTLHATYDPTTGALLAATAGQGGSGLYEGFIVKCPECGAEYSGTQGPLPRFCPDCADGRCEVCGRELETGNGPQ